VIISFGLKIRVLFAYTVVHEVEFFESLLHK
jgi:hypothetical protein